MVERIDTQLDLSFNEVTRCKRGTQLSQNCVALGSSYNLHNRVVAILYGNFKSSNELLATFLRSKSFFFDLDFIHEIHVIQLY